MGHTAPAVATARPIQPKPPFTTREAMHALPSHAATPISALTGMDVRQWDWWLAQGYGQAHPDLAHQILDGIEYGVHLLRRDEGAFTE